MIRNVTLPGGETAWAIIEPPDGSSPVELSIMAPQASERSLAEREARRLAAAAPRLRIRWTSTAAALDDLPSALTGITDDHVIIPLWPWLDDTTPWSGSLILCWDEQTATVNPPDPDSWQHRAPAIVGRLSRIPDIAIAGDAISISWDIAEDGPLAYAWSPPAPAPSPGPDLPDGTQVSIWPWHLLPSRMRILSSVRLHTLGDHRATASSTYPHSPWRIVELGNVVLPEPAAAMAWLWHHAGDYIWIPDPSHRASLLAAAPQGASSIDISPAEWADAHPWIASLGPERYSAHRVTGRAGNTITISPSLPAAITPATCSIHRAILCRLDGEVSVRIWPGYAEMSTRWTELPPEYAAQPPGWTRGTHIGHVPPIARLYEVIIRGITWRWTDWEADLSWAAQTYPSRPTEPPTIIQSSDLQDDALSLRMRRAGASGADWLDLWRPGALLDARLVIRECNPDGANATNVLAIWQGTITAITWDGPIATVQAEPLHATLGRHIPRLLIQHGCNHRLFDSLCGLSRSAWIFTASVVSASGPQVTIGSITRPGGLPAGFGFEHWFAWGMLERSSGEQIIIADSAALAGGQITLSLLSPPEEPLAAGETITLLPNCDGLPSTCQAYDAASNPTGKFDNWANFGGFPYLPALNPSLRVTTQSIHTGGKK